MAEFTRLLYRDTVAGVPSPQDGSDSTSRLTTEDGPLGSIEQSPDPPTMSAKTFGLAVVRSSIRLVLLAVVVVFVWRFASRLGWRELAQRVADADREHLILAFCCLISRFGLIYHRWWIVLRILRLPLSKVIVFASLMTGVLLNHVTPTARVLGGIVRARGLSRIYSESFASFYGTILVEQVGNQLIQIALLWLAVIPFSWSLGWHSTAVGTATVPPLIVAVWLLWRRLRGEADLESDWTGLLQRRVGSQIGRLGSLASGGRRVAEIFRIALADRWLQGRLAAYGVAIVVVNAAALWLVLRSLRTDVGFLEAFATVSLGLAAGMLTGTPGGFATTEAAMIALLVALGVDKIDATAGVFLYRGLHYSLVLIFGTLCAVGFESRVARTSRIKDEPSRAETRELR